MRLFRIILLFAAISLYIPVTTEAAFFVKKAAATTTQVIAAGEHGKQVFTNISTERSTVAAAHKKTFFGRVFEKVTHVNEAFSAGKKKWVAILLGFLDVFVLGFIGLPRFYMGYTSIGLMQLIFTLLGFVGVFLVIYAFILGNATLLIPAYLCIGLCVFSEIWQIVDLIRILCNSLKPKGGYWDK